jgi:hypothetical protein
VIIGYFRTVGGARRPFVRCEVAFPAYPDITPASIEFVVDTGSDLTTISPLAAGRACLRVATLDLGQTTRGVGSTFSTRTVESRIIVQGYSTLHTLHIPDVDHSMPSLLGRDFMRDFALFMEERTGRVLLLDQDDLESFAIPPLS